MATFTWSGTGNASTTTNWTPNGTPGASDTVVFGDSGGACNFDLASVLVISSTGTPSYTVTFANTVTGIKAFTHNFAISAGSAIALSFSGVATLASGTRFIDITSNASITNPQNITYAFDATSTAGARFDGGEYPNVELNKGQISFQYSAPTVSTNTTVSFRNVTLAANLNTADQALSPVSSNDQSMIFHVTGTLTNNATSFNGGRAKWIFEGVAAPGFALPVSTATFQSQFRSIEIQAAAGVGKFVTIPDGSFLNLEELVIANGAAIKALGAATIFVANNPDIKGTWNFNQASPGVYVSKNRKFLVGVGHGGTGLTGLGTAGQVLKVNSGATALEYGAGSALDIDALASLGGTGLHQTQDNFVFSDNGTEKKITFSNLEDAIFANVSGDATIAAGGALTIATDAVELAMLQDITDERILGRVDNSDGSVAELTKAQVLTMLNVADGATASSGTVTSVATSSPITGGTITGSGTIGISAATTSAAGSMSGADKTKLDGIAASATAYTDTLAQTASLGVPLTTVTLGTTVSNFTSGAYTIAPLNNVVKDVTSSWDGSGYYFTAPADGIYHVTFNASIQGLTTLSHVAITRLYKEVAGGSGFNFIASGSTARQSGAVAVGNVTLALNQLDKLALYVYHDGGSSKNLLGDSGAPNYTMMSIRMVGV